MPHGGLARVKYATYESTLSPDQVHARVSPPFSTPTDYLVDTFAESARSSRLSSLSLLAHATPHSPSSACRGSSSARLGLLSSCLRLGLRHRRLRLLEPAMLPLLRGRADWRAPNDARGPRDPQHALAQRFARALTLRDHQAATLSRKRGARTKNCATVKREERRRRRELRLTVEGAAGPPSDPSQALALAMDANEMPATDEEEQLLGAIRNLQADIAQLERSAMLRDSGMVLWRTNRSGAALDMANEYIMQISGGYDPCNPLRAGISENGRQFMEKFFMPDLLCRDFQGLESFMNQWEKYTIFHDDFIARLTGLRVLTDSDKRVSIYIASDFLLTFTENTIKYLYPALEAEAQRDVRTREIVDHLIGSRMRLPLDIVLHFNEHGRVFAFESRSHLNVALLETLEDHAAAEHVFCLALMTRDGHWKLAPDPDQARRVQRVPQTLN